MGGYKRSTVLIKKGLQFRYMGVIVVVMLTVAVIVGWVIYTTIWGAISDRDLTLDKLDDVFDSTNVKLLYYLLGVTIVIGFSSIFISHKIAGPVYRFEESAKRIADGDLSFRIYLRTGDELQNLGNVFNQMMDSLESHLKKDSEIIKNIKVMIDKISVDMGNPEFSIEQKKELVIQLSTITQELEKFTSSFKISSENNTNSQEAVEEKVA